MSTGFSLSFLQILALPILLIAIIAAVSFTKKH